MNLLAMERSEKPTRVLVNSPDASVGRLVAEWLSPKRFAVVSSRPGVEFMEAARRERPSIAIIDRIHERSEMVYMEISVLKELRPGVRIIAVSEDPSEKDGWILEQGVFYYMTLPAGQGLARIVEAAARPKRDGLTASQVIAY